MLAVQLGTSVQALLEQSVKAYLALQSAGKGITWTPGKEVQEQRDADHAKYLLGKIQAMR